MKLTAISIDDEPKALDIIQRYSGKIDLIDLKAVFREPAEALSYLKKENIDLIFLDINMPELTGIQFAKLAGPDLMIIFTTAYSEYAIESYELNAVDYLLKPVTFERFFKAVNKAFDIYRIKNIPSEAAILTNEKKEIHILLKSGTQLHKVLMSDILYLEKEANYMTVHLKNTKILIRENMSAIFETIPAEYFIRVHKSYIVALQHIQMVDTHHLIVNNTNVPLGITYKDELLKRFENQE